jgi:hypothetical protein
MLTLSVSRLVVVIVVGGVAPKSPGVVWDGVERLHQCPRLVGKCHMFTPCAVWKCSETCTFGAHLFLELRV